jgi:hypothetical protein
VYSPIRHSDMGRDVGSQVQRRAIEKLTALAVRRATLPGHYGDGGGLWLQVSVSGSKSWVFRFTRDGRAREMGLGSLITVSLAEARASALQRRKELQDGLDPIEHKRAGRRADRVAGAARVTFRADAEAYIERTGPAGRTRNMPTNGRTPSRRTPSRCWATYW